MAIPVLIDSQFIERLVRKTYQDGMVPEVEGRLGRNNLMHACYRLRLLGPPSVISTDDGSLVVTVPVEGHISIPWGWGTKFMVEAVADLRPRIAGSSIIIEVGEFDVNRMSMGEGCSLPPEVLRLIGPFIMGAMFPAGSGKENGIKVELPVITIPLEGISDGITKVNFVFEDFMISSRGVVLYIGLPEDHLTTLPPQPSNNGFDIVAAIPQTEAERLLEITIRENNIEIRGENEMAIPDQSRFIDLLKASGETIVSLGRRGLGRRALKSSSRVRISFTARTGSPKIDFLEGNKVLLHDIPAHVLANAVIEMDMPSSGLLARIRSFFAPKREKELSGEQKEKVTVARWTIDEDFLIREVEVSVGTEKTGHMLWKVTKLEIDMDLKWYLPERTIEEIIEFIGEKVATARLPKDMPAVLDLPGDLPLRLVIDRMDVTTVPGTMIVGASVHLAPTGPPEQTREAVKVMVEEEIGTVLKDRL